MNLEEATRVDIADGTLLRAEVRSEGLVIEVMQFNHNCIRLTFSDWLYFSVRPGALCRGLDDWYDMNRFELVANSPLIPPLLTSHGASPIPEEFLDYGHLQLIDCDDEIALEIVAAEMRREPMPRPEPAVTCCRRSACPAVQSRRPARSTSSLMP